MEWLKAGEDYLLIMGRIATILPLLLFLTLYMGKRAIGEMPVFDFLIVVVLGAIVGADIADPKIEHLPTAFAIVIVALLQRIVAFSKITSRKMGKWFTFEPTVVVHKGKLMKDNLKQIRYSIDNILNMLREHGVFDLAEVELAILEANGKMSVKKDPLHDPPTRKDWRQTPPPPGIALPVIVEGQVLQYSLDHLGLDDQWMKTELENADIPSIDDVFFASVDKHKKLTYTLYQEVLPTLPPLRH
ncbi:uncharacterized membrane protein YcaP (DUF421 family) [Desmospora profundinema]|uniref:Uncharacterized membrane protein YcaP (DUF421 family) n=1 Tax=Desmospora profundinema TaxID=1571184 RepID=A0ABU1ILT9_9BACL|nr:uncharacterized membrane protein YcaP (DUF421 family) [Desmospora profundinema]